ncbi:putative trehalose-phosphate phosphatase J [Senna tora]|uniref:Putative trehalose-phosphate phosphatase J n=1 Tax=Senna tora TaxID=362788 RepID=A0A834X1D0_9FABA|nr:putative trehalose-phosphate phosphatase J [Senna tora]
MNTDGSWKGKTRYEASPICTVEFSKLMEDDAFTTFVQVYNFVRLAELYYAGSHGMNIQGPTKISKYNKDNKAVLFQPACEYLPMMDEVSVF